MDNRRSKNNKVSRGKWKAVEIKIEKTRIVKRKRKRKKKKERREKRRSRRIKRKTKTKKKRMMEVKKVAKE